MPRPVSLIGQLCISCFDDDNDQYHPPKLSEFGAHLVELLNSSDKNIQEMRQKNENMFVGLCCISSNTDPVIDCSFIDQRLVYCKLNPEHHLLI